MFAVLE
jgi:ribosomal protein L14E/L6E/L27E